MTSQTRRRLRACAVVLLVGSISTPIPAHGGHVAADDDGVVLYFLGAHVAFYPDGYVCLYRPPAGWDQVVITGTGTGISGPLEYLTRSFEFVDDKIVVQESGHTIVLQSWSDMAIIDGKRVRLEEDVWDVTARVLVPWDTLAPLLGYQLIVDRPPAPKGQDPESGWSVILLAKGRRVPQPVLFVRTLLIPRPPQSWVLLIHRNETTRYTTGCGIMSPLSGTLIHSGDGPWADAAALAKEIPAQIAWDARQDRGSIRYRGKSAAVSARRTARGWTVSVGTERLTAPAAAGRLLDAGKMAVPVESVARALGWIRYGIDHYPILVITPR